MFKVNLVPALTSCPEQQLFKAMKTVSFLCLMFVLVCSAPTSKNKKQIKQLLLEIITEANRTYTEVRRHGSGPIKPPEDSL